MMKHYRPSNGTEGDIFASDWCEKCSLWDDDKGCPIYCASLAYYIDDAEYPKEWVRDKSGPRCTAYVDSKLQAFLNGKEK